MAQATEPIGFSREAAAQLWASLFADTAPDNKQPLSATAPASDLCIVPPPLSVSDEPSTSPEPQMLAVGFEVDELAADFEIDLLADVDELDWQLTPTVTPRSTAHRQLFSIRQVLALLQPVIAEGEMTWARLIGCVRLVGADPYSVARIAAELADADVGVLTESPRQSRGRGGTLRASEDGKCEQVAREAFAGLRQVPLTWARVAAALGELSSKVAPSLRPRLLQYYAMHQLDRREEAALFTRLDELRAAHPNLDPARDPDALDAEETETEGERLLRWRNLPAVAAIYHALCEDNLWLVARIALPLANRRMGFDDLFQEGCIGLLRAVDRFEPQRGFRFVTYAGNWVNQRIQRAIQNSDNVIRLPVHARDAYERGNDLFEDSEVVGRLPSHDELDAATHFKSSSWRHLRNVRRVLPLHRSRAAMLVVDDTPGPEELVMNRIVHEVLDQLIEQRGGKQQELLRERLNLSNPPSLEAVAQRHGITRERVRQIADKFCRKVRPALAVQLDLKVARRELAEQLGWVVVLEDEQLEIAKAREVALTKAKSKPVSPLPPATQESVAAQLAHYWRTNWRTSAAAAINNCQAAIEQPAARTRPVSTLKPAVSTQPTLAEVDGGDEVQQFINQLIDAATANEVERALLRVRFNFEQPLSSKATAERIGVGRNTIFKAHLKLLKYIYDRMRATLISELREHKALLIMTVWMRESSHQHNRIAASSAVLAQRVEELAATINIANGEQPGT